MNFRKRILSAVLALTMVLGMAVPSFAEVGGTITRTPVNPNQITIIHTNDTHSRIIADDKSVIGFDKVAAVKADLVKAGENVLLLDAGDTFHGLPFANIPKGESIVQIMKTAGYDFMTPGNHDFNYGQERLIEISKTSSFGVLSANIVDSTGKLLFTPNVVKDVNGIKVGIFGLTTPETAVKSSPANVIGLTFKDPITVAKEQVALLKEQGAKVIIALCHMGIDPESKNNTSYALRDAVDGIDLIVDGHSHTKLSDYVQVEGKALISSTGYYNGQIGVATIEINEKGNNVVAKNISFEDAKTIVPVEAVTKELDAASKSNPALKKVVGKTDVVLDGERERVRAGETNLSKLIAEAMLDTTGADIAMVNGGNIRVSIDIGDITMEEIAAVLPFGNVDVTIEVTGENMIKAIEHGTRSYPTLAGAFPQMAGLTYTLDCNQAAGSRVSNVQVAGVPIDNAKKYVLAVNDFLAIGGDGYTMFTESKIVKEYKGSDEVLTDYITKLGTLTAENTSFENKATIIEATAPAVPEIEIPGASRYTVVVNDVLWKIAKRFNTTWRELAKINNLKNANLIYPGQVLILE